LGGPGLPKYLLSASPANEGTSIRQWAVDIVKKYSGSHFNDAQREAFMKNAVPYGGISETWNRK
jgi:hypothetical protein